MAKRLWLLRADMGIIETIILGTLGSLLAAALVFVIREWWESKALSSQPSLTMLSLSDGLSPNEIHRNSAIVQEANRIFSGRVEILTDEMLSHPADVKRIQQFYAGAKLDWDIIAARADIPRDQHEDFIEQVRRPSEGTRLVCTMAEAGAGKSTSAWRISADLHQQQNALVVRIKDSDDPAVWYSMPEFCAKVNRHFYLLVDDIFHDPDTATAFQELHPLLPITVLATSRPNEFRAKRLKYETSRMHLNAPSRSEKELILQKLNKSQGDLTDEQRSRLDKANQFLVLMMELTEGKELREIVRDTLERLDDLDESAYRAYEYLCFAYQHNIAVPVLLLERLDEQGRFYNLPERETTQGLIFWASRQGHLRLGHAVIAQTAAEFYAERHSPQALLAEIAAAVVIEDAMQRRFFAFLLRALAKLQSPILTLMTELVQKTISRCVERAESITELTIWRAFYRYRGQREDAEKCVEAALTLSPVSSADCNILLKLCRERGREQDALPAIAKWVTEHPALGGARPSYLGLVERYGDSDALEIALRETNLWLATHSDDSFVRTAFMGLVERKGNDKQVGQVLDDTRKWLAKHSDDTTVRTAYLGLVERKGTDQVSELIDQTCEWLVSHPSDVAVRERYLQLVEKDGSTNQVDQAIQDTRMWLVAHPEDVTVRQTWLNFVEARGSDKLKRIILNETKYWLAEHPSAKEVWKALLGWLFRADLSSEALGLAETAMTHHPNHLSVAEHYLRAVRETADIDTIKSVYENLMANFPNALPPRVHYAAWLRDHGYHSESEQNYKALIQVLPNRAPRKLKASTHYGYGKLLLKLGRFNEATAQFREVLRIHRGHQSAHDGLALALWKLGDFGPAEQGFKKAVYWAGLHGEFQAKFYSNLGWFYVDRERWPDSLQAFESARDEDPEYFGNYWGIGRALYGLGDYKGAEDNLRLSLAKEPNLEPPASDEIPELLARLVQLAKGSVSTQS